MLDQVHRLLVVVYVLRFYKSEGELGVCVHVCNVMRLHDGLLHEGKGKGHPRTGHEGPDREQRFCSTLSLTSALDLCVCGWSKPLPGRSLPPRERPGTHCT